MADETERAKGAGIKAGWNSDAAATVPSGVFFFWCSELALLATHRSTCRLQRLSGADRVHANVSLWLCREKHLCANNRRHAMHSESADSDLYQS